MDYLDGVKGLEELDDIEEEGYPKISFYDEELDGEVEFFIIEKTKVNGTEYLLAAQELEEDSESDAYIFRVTQGNFDQADEADDASEIVLELVEDDTELEAIGKVFSELLSDDLNIDV